jgi:hypothetical protein
MTSASRTTSHPVAVDHVVSSTNVPGTYRRWDGTLVCTGPTRKNPADRSSRVAKTLAESGRGKHNHSTAPSGAMRAVVVQSDKKA